MTETVLEAASFPITLTAAAAERVKQLMEKQNNPNLFLRVGVKGGGCSGLSYTLAMTESQRENDICCIQQGIRLLTDPKSAIFLQGVTLDYSLANLLEGGWKWHNPNAQRSCGCGTSFTPKT